jgi:hypothetical protein
MHAAGEEDGTNFYAMELIDGPGIVNAFDYMRSHAFLAQIEDPEWLPWIPVTNANALHKYIGAWHCDGGEKALSW